MAIAVVQTGPANVKVGTGVASALEQLGFSANGVEITETALFLDVPGDQNGGDEGPPIDVQFLGQIDRVRMELTKYDIAIANKVRTRLNNIASPETAGVPGTSGSLIAGSSLFYRLLIEPTTQPRNYIAAIPREPIEVNRGTKYSRLIIEFECHSFNGTLWDTTVA